MVQDDRDPKIPKELLQRPEFVDACKTHDVRGVFELARKWGGLSQMALSRMTGIKADSVRKILSGTRLVEDFAVYERIADGLGIPGDMLGLARRPWEQVALPAFTPDAGVASPTIAGSAGDATSLIDMRQLETLRLSLHRHLSEGAMSIASLDDWDQTIAEYGAATRDKPPILMIYDLANDLDQLNNAMAHCRTASALTRLTRVAAQITGLLVLSLVKLDDRAAFRRWARTARIAAVESGDSAVHAWVLMQEAHGHYYSNDYATAIHVARQAQATTNNSCVGTALSAALEARAHAAMANHGETVHALDRAETIFAALGSESLISSAFGYTESSFRFHAGSAFTNLRDTTNAAKAHERALQLIPEGDYTDLAFVHIDRASCLVSDGDAGGAASYLIDRLAPLTNEQRRGIISVRARDVIRALPQSEKGRPEVIDLMDLLSSENPEVGV